MTKPRPINGRPWWDEAERDPRTGFFAHKDHWPGPIRRIRHRPPSSWNAETLDRWTRLSMIHIKKSKWNFFGYFFSYLYYVRCTKWIYGRNLTSDDINTIWFIDCTSQNDSQESVCMIKPNCQQQKLLLLLSFAGYSIYFNFLCLILISSLFVAIKNNFR